jgi:N-methylhydantoinase A
MAARGFLLGADIGGTFTDLVIIERGTGEVTNIKTLTTPDDPARGVLQAVAEGLDLVAGRPEEVERFVHATTLPTNLVLERKGARVAFLTTDGFADMFDISAQYPSGPDRFNLRWERPPSLTVRELTVGIRERVGPHGEVRRPIDLDDAAAKLDRLAEHEPEAFAVCLLHSYANPSHERQLAELIAARFPGAMISLSCEVWPEFHEYERASATVLSAYVGPTLARYVDRLERELEALGVPAQLQIMQSSGAIMSAAEAARRAAYTIESGPAAGVMAAAHVGRESGRPDVISFDMGGTTAKAGLVLGGRPRIAQQFRVGGKVSASGQREAGEPIRIPVIDLAEVGAGGGSIAWVDAGGRLRLGPQSAGASPGPACYDLGGSDATVTDANVVLGYLDAAYFNGGKMVIRPELSHAAIAAKIADPLGLSVIDAARGIYSLANTLMGAAIRMVTLQRGTDPRDHAILAFGGAGPLHVVRLAELFSIPEIIVPPSPGVKSAYGLLVSDVAYDQVRTLVTPTIGADLGLLQRTFDETEAKGRAMLVGEADRGDQVRIDRSLDIGFAHRLQTYPIRLDKGPLDAAAVAWAEARFRQDQLDVFGVTSADQCRIMGVRLRAAAITSLPPSAPASAPDYAVDAAIKTRRPAWFDEEEGFVETPVYDRYLLGPGHCLTGPAIIEEPDATTICPPGVTVVVDPALNLLISISAENRTAARLTESAPA